LALGWIQKLQVAQDSFDDDAIVDQVDYLQLAAAMGTERKIGFEDFPQHPCPWSPPRRKVA